MNYEVREECHSKFEDPVPEEKKNICEFEDVSCLFAWWDIDENQSKEVTWAWRINLNKGERS